MLWKRFNDIVTSVYKQKPAKGFAIGFWSKYG